jgi:hypothetical protein
MSTAIARLDFASAPRVDDAPTSTAAPRVDDAAATMFDAGATRVPPWMALVAALASAQPAGIDEAIAWLVEHRATLDRAYAEGVAGRIGLATLPPAMQYSPELGFLDRARRDHGLRERYLFRDVVGKRTFFQTAIYAMTGLDLPSEDAAMLEQLGNANLQADRGAWPLAATRRVAARGGGYGGAVVAGLAMMGSPVLAGNAAADCARFLHRAQAAVEAGGSVDELVTGLLARRERVMGFGRPVVAADERVPVMQAILVRHERDQLPFVRLLRAAEQSFAAHRGLGSTSAAWAAAILSDYGMTPLQVHAVCNFWVSVCVYAHAAYATERGLATPAR